MLRPGNTRSTTICNIIREIEAEAKAEAKIEIKAKVKVKVEWTILLIN